MKEETTVNENENLSQQTLINKIEKEAIELLDNFKDHPIRSLFWGLIVLWGIKQVKNIWK